MARGAAGDTRAEIEAVALELFATQGFDKTSLREIAERLHITKAALYYHFPSKQELLASIVRPLIEDVEALLEEFQGSQDAAPREVFARIFDLVYRRRMVYLMFFQEVGAFANLGAEVARLLEWREQLNRWLLGPDATPADHARATVALGGLQDCAVLLPDTPPEQYRDAAIDAACRAFTVS